MLHTSLSILQYYLIYSIYTMHRMQTEWIEYKMAYYIYQNVQYTSRAVCLEWNTSFLVTVYYALYMVDLKNSETVAIFKQ